MAEEAAAPREQPRAGAEAPAAAPEPKGPMFSRTGLLILIMVIVLEAALVSGGYLLIFKKPAAPAVSELDAAAEAARTTQIVTEPIGDFLVNIPFDPTGREQKYLFTEISVELSVEESEDPAALAKEVSEELQDIFRDRILAILRTKEFLEIQNPENETRLKHELKTVLNELYYNRKGRKDAIDKILFTRWEIR